MVKPPASDHTKCEELVVAYRRWSLTIVQLQEGFFRRQIRIHLLTQERIAHSLFTYPCAF